MKFLYKKDCRSTIIDKKTNNNDICFTKIKTRAIKIIDILRDKTPE